MSTTKTSYGIACCRFNNKNKLEILIVKKRYTYCFASFVLGKYNKNKKFLKNLFNGMTVQEKLDILSLNFDILWYKIWMEIPSNKTLETPTEIDCIYNINLYREYLRGNGLDRYKFYKQKKAKFENLFVYGEKKFLLNLIKKTSNGMILWEIPKGRKNINETFMDCAIREFKEETGINYKNYTIMFDLDPIVNSYTSFSTTYANKYYIAYEAKHSNPKVDFSNNIQVSEIQDIKWVELDEIKFIDPGGHLSNLVNKIFLTFKHKYKKHHNSVINENKLYNNTIEVLDLVPPKY